MSPDAPLHGLRVLITRPANQAGPLVARIESLGGRALVHPVITIAPPEDEGPLEEAAQHIERYDWLLLTSVNAVDALLPRVPPARRLPAVACVGATTARALEARGIRADLVPPVFNAEGLLDALRERLGETLSRCRFLMPQAVEGRDTLQRGLVDHGARVDVVPAYRTVPCTEQRDALRATLESSEVDVLTFASPSAVDSFNTLISEIHSIKNNVKTIPCVCIGPLTAQRARALGYRVEAVAPRADTDGMAQALVEIAKWLAT